jgi:hypothetical protein
MSDTIKNILTHGAAAVGGFYFGSKSATPAERSKNIFSRFIPTLIIAYGITHFAINTPEEFFEYLKQIDKNETEIKKLEIEKKVDLYDDKINELDDTQKQLENYLKGKIQNKSDIDKNQNSKIGGIEKKLGDLQSNSGSGMNTSENGQGFVPFSSSENNAYNTWVAFDKSDQRFYFYKNQELVKSGLMIFNSSGKPAAGLYRVNDVSNRDGGLYPGFIKLDGVIGISGAGSNNEYAPAICNSNNVTRSGFRVSNDDADYLMSNVRLGTKIEVRN